MSRKTDILRRLEDSYGGRGFISKQEVVEFCGYKDPEPVDRILYGRPRIGKTKGARFRLEVVAEALADAEHC